MITIHLHNLKFFGYHGVHEEEKLLGNEYEVNVDIEFHEETAEIVSLNQTLNYVEIFKIIKKRMQIPTPLLETIVMDIGNTIQTNYKNIRSINIRLKKLHPPVTALQGSVGVSWQKAF